MSPTLLDSVVRSVFIGLCNLTWRVTLVAAAAAVCAVWLPAQNRTLRFTFWLTTLIAMAWVTVGACAGSWLVDWALPSSVSEWLKADVVSLNPDFGHIPIGPAGPRGVGDRLGSALSTELHWVPWAATVLWTAGAIAMAGRFVASRAGLFWLRGNARPVRRTEVLDMFRDLSAQIGVRRQTVVLASRDVKAPVLVGMFRRPAIILPESIAEQYPTQRLGPMLIHELAHIKRRDHIVNAFQHVLGIALYFHPAYWLVCRALEAERERSCDDYVVRVTRSPRNYALSLVELTEHVAGLAPVHNGDEPVAKGRRSATNRRVETLVARKTAPPEPSASAVAILVAAAILVAVPISASRIAYERHAAQPEPVARAGAAATFWSQDKPAGTASFRVGHVGQWRIQPDSAHRLNPIQVERGEGRVENSEEQGPR